MLNYIKSESYRMRTQKGFFIIVGVLCGLVLAMNLVIFGFDKFTPDFPYGTVRFSLNCFTGMIGHLMIVLGAVVPGCVFIEDRKNGVLKTAVASGLSREKILFGKCIAAFFYTFLVLCIVLAVYVGSAFLLLREPEWVPLREMLTGIAAVLPIATGSMISMLVLGILFRNEITVSLIWAMIWFGIPQITFLLGLKIDVFARITAWMPESFLKNEAIVHFSSYDCLWDTAQGFAKCTVAGVIGIAVFLVFGVWRYRKLEL